MREMQTLPEIVPAVFKMLKDEHYPYAVLRNHNGLPYSNKSRDIDILISSECYDSLKNDFVDLVLDAKYKITTFFESERLKTFVCAKLANNDIEIVQFDFFLHTSAYGHILLDSANILSSTHLNENGICCVSKEYEFLDKYLYLKYIGAEYPAKYSQLKEELKSSLYLKDIIQSKFGISSIEELDNMPISEFRRKAHRLNRSYKNQFLFWCSYIKNNITYKGFSLGFTGPDGSGKTTVIELLTEQLLKVYPKVAPFHFRPTVFGNLGDVAHSAGMKKTVDHNYNKPHRGGKTGFFSSLARLIYYSIDYILGYFKLVRCALTRRELVIFDRYYTDIICDSRRSRIYLNPKFLYSFGRLFIPSLDYNILLTASSDAILVRKRELDKVGIEAINQKIDYLADKKGYYKVLNEGTPQEAVTKILQIVFEEQHKKNLKRMKYGSSKI